MDGKAALATQVARKNWAWTPGVTWTNQSTAATGGETVMFVLIGSEIAGLVSVRRPGQGQHARRFQGTACPGAAHRHGNRRQRAHCRAVAARPGIVTRSADDVLPA